MFLGLLSLEISFGEKTVTQSPTHPNTQLISPSVNLSRHKITTSEALLLLSWHAVPPRLVQQAASVLTVVAGDDVLLPCDVIGDPPPVISWRKNHEDIDFHSMNHKYLIEDSGALVIPVADASDSARYLCVAENSAGIVSQEVNLIVYGLCHTLLLSSVLDQ